MLPLVAVAIDIIEKKTNKTVHRHRKEDTLVKRKPSFNLRMLLWVQDEQQIEGKFIRNENNDQEQR